MSASNTPIDSPTLLGFLDDTADLPDDVGSRLPRLVVSDTPGPTVDFVIQERIGEGGHAVVDRAEQCGLQRAVALKRLHPKNPGGTRALLREAWLTGQLDHPNIAPIYLVGETSEGDPIVVMKEVVGKPWSVRIAESPDALNDHLDVFVAVCNAVNFAHHRGIVHRDIKPSNVVVGPYGEVWLLDWGIAAPRRHGHADRGHAGLYGA